MTAIDLETVKAVEYLARKLRDRAPKASVRCTTINVAWGDGRAPEGSE